jgi:hypothetical protein
MIEQINKIYLTSRAFQVIETFLNSFSFGLWYFRCYDVLTELSILYQLIAEFANTAN